MLIQGLPPGNARERELVGHNWTDETALLAEIADRIGADIVVTAKVGGAKGMQPIKPLPRPWEQASVRRPVGDDWSDPEWTGAVGGVEEGDREVAIAWLLSKRPQELPPAT